MIDWISVNDAMPEADDVCLLYSATYDSCIGPLSWIPDSAGLGGVWVDVLAAPETGAVYSPENGVTHWTRWNAP